MAQVQFELKKFYPESISTAFKADKVRLAVALALGLGSYGLLRRFEVSRFVALSIGSTPTILYAAYSIHRANRSEQIQKAGAALVSGKVTANQLPDWIRRVATHLKDKMTQTIDSLLRSEIQVETFAGKLHLREEDAFRYRAAELLSLPEGKGQALVNEWAGANLNLDEEAVRGVIQQKKPNNLTLGPSIVRALFKKYGWEKTISDSPYMSAVVDALSLLREYQGHLPTLQHHLDNGCFEVGRNEELTLLNGGRAKTPFDQEARSREVRAAIAPPYQYAQVCPGGETRTRTLSQETHLKIFTWVWGAVDSGAKRKILEGIQCPLLVQQEIDADGFLPERRPTDLVERLEVIAFLAMKGRECFIKDDEVHNLNFRLDQVALAGLILDAFEGQVPDQKEAIRAQLRIDNQVLDAVSHWRGEPTSLLDQAIGLINLGRPS